MKLEIKTTILIQKPAHDVFEAIADGDKMAVYFLESSSGRMEEGKELIWRFREVDQDFPIRVGAIQQDKLISFYWDSDGRETLSEIHLEHFDGNATKVTVTEKDYDNTEAGIKWLRGNTEGWANFLACLKAYLEYGIDLRKGAFDYMKKQTV